MIDLLKWDQETRDNIDELVGKLRKLDASETADLETTWEALVEQARSLYEEKIFKRLQDVESVLDDEWPELEAFADRDCWPICAERPGPHWEDDSFVEYSGDEHKDEISDGLPGDLADDLHDLVEPKGLNLTAGEKLSLKKYAEVLRARLALVEGMIAE